MISEIIHIDEPHLMFGSDQTALDPRDGLLLYGPYENMGNKYGSSAFSVRAGVIGTPSLHSLFEDFLVKLNRPIESVGRNLQGKRVRNHTQRPSFPGFETVFDVALPKEPEIAVTIEPREIDLALEKHRRNRQIRTNRLVDLYLSKMQDASNAYDGRVNIWFVLVPRSIFLACRPHSYGRDIGRATKETLAAEAAGQATLFSREEMSGDDIGNYLNTASDFHNLLKARANQRRIEAPIQILVGPKLEFRDIINRTLYEDDMKAHLAWCLSTTLYYKLGKKPWKLAEARKGVCYLGLVFKRFPNASQKHYACSAAQLFLEDGDGTIFRGNNGLWLGQRENEFHIDRAEAKALMSKALKDYAGTDNGRCPTELFVHGRATFSDDEWAGFEDALRERGADSNLVGVVIRDTRNLKVFRDLLHRTANYGVLRGTALIINDTEAYLSTVGFVPRLNTSLSLGVPNPLHVRITRGDADIRTVLADIMKLTKLNYNSCIFGDGRPVTLRFSDKIGSILTATEDYKEERRQFMYYI